MQATKSTTEKIDLDIQEITLLSVEEAEKLLTQEQRASDSGWWLRSPGDRRYHNFFAAEVFIDGRVNSHGRYVTHCIGVRPALRITNLDSSNLSKGDIIKVGAESWTVISDNLALCDRLVWKTGFRYDDTAPDADVYEKSDVKNELDKWALERGIVTQGNMELFHTR